MRVITNPITAFYIIFDLNATDFYGVRLFLQFSRFCGHLKYSIIKVCLNTNFEKIDKYVNRLTTTTN